MAAPYSAKDRAVWRDGRVVCVCDTGAQGQTAEAIAMRIASLLNEDFYRFCAEACRVAGDAAAAEKQAAIRQVWGD